MFVSLKIGSFDLAFFRDRRSIGVRRLIEELRNIFTLYTEFAWSVLFGDLKMLQLTWRKYWSIILNCQIIESRTYRNSCIVGYLYTDYKQLVFGSLNFSLSTIYFSSKVSIIYWTVHFFIGIWIGKPWSFLKYFILFKRCFKCLETLCLVFDISYPQIIHKHNKKRWKGTWTVGYCCLCVTGLGTIKPMSV